MSYHRITSCDDPAYAERVWPPACDVCGEAIAPGLVEAATQEAPDYMPEDFRRRTRMLMCEPCREAEFDRQQEGAA